jgi:superfamily I DNA/RNA helicase
MTLQQQSEYRSILAYLTISASELSDDSLLRLLQVATDKDLVDALTEEIRDRQNRLQDALIGHEDDIPRYEMPEIKNTIELMHNLFK